MTERQLKYRAGIFLIFVHVVILSLAIAMFFVHGFDLNEFTTLFGIILPMFAGYTTSVIAFLIKDRYAQSDQTQPVTNTYAMLFFLFPGLFSIVIAASIWCQAHTIVFRNFDDFKNFIITIESAFAVYIGLVVYSLFHKQLAGAPRRAVSGKQRKSV
jgi:hypothetical protein